MSPAVTVEPGTVVAAWSQDGLDGQIGPDTRGSDLRHLDRNRIHPLTGPVAIAGAEPGHCVTVEVLEVRPERYGFTHQRGGLGLLREEFSEPCIAHWRIDDGYAVSDQMPGVRVPGDPFLGVVGVAPSRDLEDRWRLVESNWYEPGPQGLSTGPPRQNGGNLDLRQLHAGSTLHLPVLQHGGLLSVGDAHFRQGDGEVCGSAIEVSATSILRVGLHDAEGHEREPWLVEGPARVASGGAMVWFPAHTRVLDGVRQEDLLETVRRALLRLVDWISSEWGLSRRYAYALCSVACEIRMGQAVSEPYLSVLAGISRELYAS